jgi:hypothetical protein
VVERRGRGPTDTVAAENFEFDISSDTDDICILLWYIINTLWCPSLNKSKLVTFFVFINGSKCQSVNFLERTRPTLTNV